MHFPEVSLDLSTPSAGDADPQPDRTRLRSRLANIDRPRLTLAFVAIAHGVLPLLILGAHHFYGHDETVYLSQYSEHSPAAYFSAPRSRGTPLLVAPVTALTSSIAVLRIYLATLSGLATYLAFMPWFKALGSTRRPMSPYVVPVAAAFVSTLWVSVYYSFEAMPDEWSMLGVVAAVGLVLSADRQPRKRTAIAIILTLAITGLFRPQDSLWPGAALLVCIGFFRDRSLADRLRLAGIVTTGLVVGWADWIGEAYAYFHGPINRIHESLAQNGGVGVHFSLKAQWSVLSGPLLCHNSCVAHSPGLNQVWWVVGSVLVVAALIIAWRSHNTRIVAVCIACGLAVVVEYAVSVNYGAPRFLLPTYGLLSIPVAIALIWLVRSWKPLVPLVVLGCLAQVAVQAHVLFTDIKAPIQQSAAERVALDTRLERVGVNRHDCQLYWNQSAVVSAYVLGCRDHLLRTADSTEFPAIARNQPTYVVTKRVPAKPTWYGDWPRQWVHSGDTSVYVWSNHLADPAMSFDFVGASGRFERG